MGLIRAKCIITLCAVRCNSGASCEDIQSYRLELVKAHADGQDDAALDLLVQEALKNSDCTEEDLFNPGTLDRAAAKASKSEANAQGLVASANAGETSRAVAQDDSSKKRKRVENGEVTNAVKKDVDADNTVLDADGQERERKAARRERDRLLKEKKRSADPEANGGSVESEKKKRTWK